MPALSIVTYTAKASAVSVVGTEYWPSSSGFDLSLVEDASSFAVHVTDAGHATATVDFSIEVYDGTNWMTDSTITFTQITTVAKKYVKVVAPTLWGTKVRLKQVTGTATSGLSSAKFIYSSVPGSYSA